MKIICSWCKKVLGEKEPFDDPSESHARCPECLEKQKREEELKKVEVKPAEKSRKVIVDGIEGTLTIAGKESPTLAFMEIDFSGKKFTCLKETHAAFEKHIASLPGDEVSVTWLHSGEFYPSEEWQSRRRKKKNEDPPKPKEPKKENVTYNCTIKVSKVQAHQVFNSSISKVHDFAKMLAEITVDVVRRETIPVDTNLSLLFPIDGDIPAIVNFMTDKEIYDHTIQIPYPYMEADGKKFMEDSQKRHLEFNHTMDWGIRKEKAEIIGMIGFQGRSKKEPGVEEVGFWLGKLYWNQGIMTKVLKKITEHGFAKYNLKRIEMKIFVFNKASCRVAEKCGYKFEKLVPAAYEKDGKKIDAKLYAIENQNVQVDT